jgi:hypothetical protein
MPTNPIGRNTKNVGVNLPKDLISDLDVLCEKSGVSRNRYIRTVLEAAAANNWQAVEERLLLRETADAKLHIPEPAKHAGRVIYRMKKKQK